MKKKIYKIILIILLSILIIAIIGFFCLRLFLKLNLNGDEVINLSYNDTYNDEGAKAFLFKKNINSSIKVEDNINYKKTGTYYIKYSVNYFGVKKNIKRTINILDKEKPNITLKGNNSLYLSINNEYKEPGYEVSDNYDSDLKVEINGLDKLNTKIKGEYIIEYKVIDSSGNFETVERKVIVQDRIIVKNGVTYIDGILLVNKQYSIPKTYGNGNNQEALNKFKLLQNDAKKVGYTINLLSSYRSYEYQRNLYNNYVKLHGQAEADTFSARPGHSEHQTGLAFDVGKIDNNYGNTSEGIWLAKNAHKYGFIIRYPKGKEKITGYMYEPWHIRYLGIDIATKVYNSGLCLEEYLKV